MAIFSGYFRQKYKPSISDAHKYHFGKAAVQQRTATAEIVFKWQYHPPSAAFEHVSNACDLCAALRRAHSRYQNYQVRGELDDATTDGPAARNRVKQTLKFRNPNGTHLALAPYLMVGTVMGANSFLSQSCLIGFRLTFFRSSTF